MFEEMNYSACVRKFTRNRMIILAKLSEPRLNAESPAAVWHLWNLPATNQPTSFPKLIRLDSACWNYTTLRNLARWSHSVTRYRSLFIIHFIGHLQCTSKIKNRRLCREKGCYRRDHFLWRPILKIW